MIATLASCGVIHSADRFDARAEGSAVVRETEINSAQSTFEQGWTNMTPSVAPSGRFWPAMAYDSNSDRVILFGGSIGPPAYVSNETWAYDFNSNTWTNMSPDMAPSYVEAFDAMVSNSRRNATLLFSSYDRQTWIYEYTTNRWTSLNQAGPSRLVYFDMAYDSQSDRVVLYGGWLVDAASRSWETWGYNGATNTWTSMGFGPPGRSLHAMAYDSQSDRVVLYGGDGPDGPTDETWTYDVDTNTWTEMNPAVRPPALLYHAMTYDAQSDRTILFGGVYYPYQSQVISNETWAYDIEADNWTKLSSRVVPDPRGFHRLAYDSESDRVILFGGASNVSFYYNDTWALRYNQTYPSAPRDVQAAPGDARITLTWQSPEFDGGLPIEGYQIYRGTTAGGESLFTTVSSVRTYTDAGIANGVTYYYRISAVNAIGEGPRSGEVSATPSAAPDTTKPTVAIIWPSPGSLLSSDSVTVTGTSSDDVAVQKVELGADGMNWVLASGTTSWSATLALHEGTNTIYVRVTDTSGNTATTTVTFTVETPTAGANVSPLLLASAGASLVAAATVGFLVWKSRSRRRLGL